MSKKLIPPKANDLSAWYNQVIKVAELAEHGPAKGTMIIKPYGYAIWERIQAELDAIFKQLGVENGYFPLLIPMSLLEKEQSHVEGFSPELAVVTYGGGAELKEPLAVRPTSETIMYEAYSRWVQSWRDLPLLINQWNNVVRWELRTYLFLRSSEFLWQEGHTAHASHKESQAFQKTIMDVYEKMYREYFALDGFSGEKSESERFAGADSTMTYEALMPDGRTLQSCTSHDLGQNFSKPFNIKYQAKDGKEAYVWQTSWGFSTRSIGGLIMAHGDDNGLRLPPKLAPQQVVILPVQAEPELQKYAETIAAELKQQGLRVKIDAKADETIGFRINKWEVKGAPLRVEVGKQELDKQQVTLARRDNGEKQTLAMGQLAGAAPKLLEEIQQAMYKQSQDFRQANTQVAKDFKAFQELAASARGFIQVAWCEAPDCEAKVKEQTKAKTSCRPFGAKKATGSCFHCDRPAKCEWLFAQSY